eukprot:COSAG02_NODE_1711_length_11223_cov_5.622348_16_plen_229_part_00
MICGARARARDRDSDTAISRPRDGSHAMACAAADDLDAALLALDVDELVRTAEKSRNKRQSAAVESPMEPQKASRHRIASDQESRRWSVLAGSQSRSQRPIQMACAAADDFDAALLALDVDELVQTAEKSRNKRQSAAVESPTRRSPQPRAAAAAAAESPESPACYVCTRPADEDRACEDCDKPMCGGCKLVSTVCEGCYQGVLAMPPEAQSCYRLDNGLCHTVSDSA